MGGSDVAPDGSPEMPARSRVPVPIDRLGEETEVPVMVDRKSSQHRQSLQDVPERRAPHVSLEICRRTGGDLPGTSRIPRALHVQQTLGGAAVHVLIQLEACQGPEAPLVGEIRQPIVVEKIRRREQRTEPEGVADVLCEVLGVSVDASEVTTGAHEGVRSGTHRGGSIVYSRLRRRDQEL